MNGIGSVYNRYGIEVVSSVPEMRNSVEMDLLYLPKVRGLDLD